MSKLWSGYKGFCGRIVAYSWLLVVVWLLQFIISLQLFYMWTTVDRGVVVHNLIGITFWSVLLTSLVVILPSRIRQIGCWGLLGFIFLIVAFEQYLISCYQTCLTNTMAMVILSTNTHEAREFLSTLSIRPFILFFVLILATALVGVAIRWMAKKVKVDKTWKVVLISFILFFPFTCYIIKTIPHHREGLKSTFPNYAMLAPIDRLWQVTYLTWGAVDHIDELTKEFASMDIGMVETSKDFGSHSIVLIIGESLRRNSMHCYGSSYPTTPHLDSLVGSGNLILFTDVVSSKPNTDPSLCELLTFHTTDQSHPWYKYPSIVQTMSAAGYYTYWLSNQEKVIRIGQAMLVIPPLSDSTLFVNTRLADDDWTNTREVSLDERVLSHLMKSNKLPGQKDRLFEIIHLSGQHTVFSKRYPKSYARFKPEDMVIPIGDPQAWKKAIMAEYLNSILYNDWVVSTIMRSYDDIPALIFYVSDHGLNMFDNPENPNSSNHDVSKQALPIPFMIYITPAMEKLHPELYTQIDAAKGRSIMSDILTHSITGLLGITGRESNDKYNVFGSKYWSERPRVINAFERSVDFPHPVTQDPAIKVR